MVSRISGGEGSAAQPRGAAGPRKRAALETYARHEDALRRTARRYSLCVDDADDALQRALEILLTKAPTDDPRELIRWTQTVVKHEALAVRRDRERILSGPAAIAAEDGREDWVALIPTDADGPPERAERHEAIARSREALQALKPQELRALSLLAEGYSYAEIGAITGFSQTKVNRCLAEGRERFRRLLSRGEDGSRCEEMRPVLSAFCDGESGTEEAAALREHLRACASCRATLRAYRAAPRAAAALAPALPVTRSLLDRAHDALAELAARFGGGPSTDSALSQVAATGGARGAGMAALAKVVAICAGTAGGAAACVAAGMVPAPLEIGHSQAKAPVLERKIGPVVTAEWSHDSGVEYEPAPQPTPAEPAPTPIHHDPEPVAQPASSSAPASASGAVEYAPEPAPVVEAASGGGSTGSASGSPAGEFGP
ncbi:MAG TPA: sigma-70 family RNA polymerase sigma factor [Solirubrobacterales bacterium]|nr:sigma-70 family RNA polymerase sigma factor [Solirubrobacterales bacterium]